MTLLLATSTVDVRRPGSEDSHGWASEDWSSVGSATVGIQPNQEYGNTDGGGASGSKHSTANADTTLFCTTTPGSSPSEFSSNRF